MFEFELRLHLLRLLDSCCDQLSVSQADTPVDLAFYGEKIEPVVFNVHILDFSCTQRITLQVQLTREGGSITYAITPDADLGKVGIIFVFFH